MFLYRSYRNRRTYFWKWHNKSINRWWYDSLTWLNFPITFYFNWGTRKQKIWLHIIELYIYIYSIIKTKLLVSSYELFFMDRPSLKFYSTKFLTRLHNFLDWKVQFHHRQSIVGALIMEDRFQSYITKGFPSWLRHILVTSFLLYIWFELSVPL